MGRTSFISSLAAAAEAGVFETLPLSSTTSKLKLLNTYWEKLETDHEKLLSSKTDVMIEHKYFTDDSFETTLKQFQAAADGLYTRIADIEAKLPSQGSVLANSSVIQSLTIYGFANHHSLKILRELSRLEIFSRFIRLIDRGKPKSHQRRENALPQLMSGW